MNFRALIKKIEIGFLRAVLKVIKFFSALWRGISPRVKKNYRHYLKTAGISVLALYLIGAVVFGVRLYGQKRFESMDYVASHIYPFPVANTGRSIIFARKLQSQVRWAKNFAETMEVPVPEDFAERILDDAIVDSLVMQETSRLGIQITGKDIDETFALAAEGIGGEEQAANFVQTNYGMSLGQFKKLILPKIAIEKVRDEKFVKVKARHILIQDDGKAREILEKVKDGGNFEELAKEHSEDKSSSEEGGLLIEGEMFYRETIGLPEEMEEKIFALKKGEVSELVKTDLGNHIIKIEEREGEIEKSMTDWIDDLKKKYPVRVWI